MKTHNATLAILKPDSGQEELRPATFLNTILQWLPHHRLRMLEITQEQPEGLSMPWPAGNHSSRTLRSHVLRPVIGAGA